MRTIAVGLLGMLLAWGAEPLLELERQYRSTIRQLEADGSSIALSNALNGLAALYFEQGDFKRAQKLSERALEVEMESEGPRDLEIGRRVGNIGSAMVAQGNVKAGEPLIRESMKAFESLGAAYEQAFALNALGTIEMRRKNHEAARRYYEAAVELWRDHPLDRARGVANVAMVYTALGRPEAVATWSRALASAERDGVSERERGVMLCGYAEALARAGRKSEGVEQRRRGQEMMRGVVGMTIDRTDFR